MYIIWKAICGIMLHPNECYVGIEKDCWGKENNLEYIKLVRWSKEQASSDGPQW